MDNCEHIKRELYLEGTTSACYVECCELTHEVCLGRPKECYYYQLYEKGKKKGYKEGWDDGAHAQREWDGTTKDW